MKRKSLSERTIFTKQITSTVSVMLVILILGLVGTIAVGTREAADILKSRTGFTVVMSDFATEAETAAVKRQLAADPGVRTTTFTTATQHMERWNRENGEDVMQMLGVNPFPADFEVKVKANRGNPDSLSDMSTRYRQMAGVEEVPVNYEVSANLNHDISIVNMILGGVALGLLLISFVLINNTVRLTVYSRRFLIHTMKLVGATGGFIRRPFVRSGFINGLVAGIFGSGVLALLIYAARTRFPAMAQCLPFEKMWWLFPSMILISIIICSLASTMATNRYLKMEYDDLF